MKSIHPRLAVTAVSFAVTTLFTIGPANAQGLTIEPTLTVTFVNFGVTSNGGYETLKGILANTTIGDIQNLAVLLNSFGFQAAGTKRFVATRSDSDFFDDNPTNLIGNPPRRGELQVTVTDLETSGVTPVATATLTQTLTCNLDSSGNGTCS
ncbi:hypothetical protein ACFVFQ_20115 [Streptomyces sp. NPDC057743]|uniref:hypothetical protein n=1 Tax=Streptomyces sp. NPDC057743 TaxID=3346236 RepID=UPI003693B670